MVGNMANLLFRFKKIVSNESNVHQQIISWISVSKCYRASSKNVVLRTVVTCKKIGYSEQWICSEQEKNWREMGIVSYVSECEKRYKYILEVDINVCPIQLPLVKLYKDSSCTDFHLSSGEGSVAVHKACLAAHSDIFKTMFGGNWKETVESRVELEGVTLETLQQLKDYLYLGSLPQQGLRELLLLAMRYMIDSLKAECITSLASSSKVKQDDLFDLLEFARKNEIPELTLALIELTPKRVVGDISPTLESLDDEEEGE